MCEHCALVNKGDVDILTQNKKLTPFISLRLVKDGLKVSSLKANFCPMCGEPLTEPKPLTLEELEEREYKAVYVKVIDREGLNFCCEDDIVEGAAFVRKSWARIPNYLKADLRYTDYDFDDYGKTWLAYDREPKKENE